MPEITEIGETLGENGFYIFHMLSDTYKRNELEKNRTPGAEQEFPASSGAPAIGLSRSWAYCLRGPNLLSAAFLAAGPAQMAQSPPASSPLPFTEAAATLASNKGFLPNVL